MAEYYSADLAEKVSRGMTENAFKARYNGGNIPFVYITSDEIANMANSSDIQSDVLPNVKNPNYFVNRNWFGFVLYILKSKSLLFHPIPQTQTKW